MKKRKILVVALIGLLMAGGLAFIGCDEGGSYSGTNGITIYCGGYCNLPRRQCATKCTRKENVNGTCICE
jgi:hypothetical protein